MKRWYIIFLLTIGLPTMAQDTTPTPVQPEEDKVYTQSEVDVQAEFPGGLAAFYSKVNKKFKIPKLKNNMTARIYVSFIVGKDGAIGDYKILRDPGHGLGEEAVRVLKLIKEKWSPGMVGGIPVRTLYNLPITINIKS